MAKRSPACSRDTSAKQKPCITNNYILGCVGEILHTLFLFNGNGHSETAAERKAAV